MCVRSNSNWAPACIERNTRRQTLTEIGASDLECCREVLASVAAADQVAEAMRIASQGVLRISAPVAYGAQRLVQVISNYAVAYPKVTIDLALNDRVVDLADEAVDVAIRSGALLDATLVARPLQATRMLAATSPANLKRCGVPRHPAELEHHQCLAFSAWSADPVWRFTQGDCDVRVPVRGSFTSNHGHALLSAALAGMGVVLQNDTLLEPAIARGELQLLLPAWQLPLRAMHIVHHPKIWPSAKVPSFVDFVLARLA